MAASKGLMSEKFLHAVVRDSKYVGLTLAVVGAAVTRDYRFVIALGIGSAVDIFSLSWIVEHGRLAGGGRDLATAVAGVTVFRVVVKSVLVTGAALLADGSVVWGMILGVLVVEITLMTVGVFDSIKGVTSS